MSENDGTNMKGKGKKDYYRHLATEQWWKMKERERKGKKEKKKIVGSQSEEHEKQAEVNGAYNITLKWSRNI